MTMFEKFVVAMAFCVSNDLDENLVAEAFRLDTECAEDLGWDLLDMACDKKQDWHDSLQSSYCPLTWPENDDLSAKSWEYYTNSYLAYMVGGSDGERKAFIDWCESQKGTEFGRTGHFLTRESMAQVLPAIQALVPSETTPVTQYNPFPCVYVEKPKGIRGLLQKILSLPSKKLA